MAKILADTEIRKKLEHLFRCRRETVSLALNCHSNSDLSKRIRKTALDMGASVKKEEKVTILK